MGTSTADGGDEGRSKGHLESRKYRTAQLAVEEKQTQLVSVPYLWLEQQEGARKARSKGEKEKGYGGQSQKERVEGRKLPVGGWVDSGWVDSE